MSESSLMSTQHSHSNFPKLHNAMWPGFVGKGSPGAEPTIDLDTMLELTSNAKVDGIGFDGVDLFLFDPHINIDIDDDGIKALAEKILSHNFVVGSVVAPVWPPTGGGSAMGTEEERTAFISQVQKACRIGQRLRELGARPYGVVRIDSGCSVSDWTQDAETNQRKIVQTFGEACNVAESMGERLAAEGEICWGGMHSWKKMLDLLERVNRPNTLGFQADMAHTLLYILGYNAPEDALLPADWDWSDPRRLDAAMKVLTQALGSWTIDFHVAQNDATVKGSGTHDKTGHHCLPDDPDGKLTIPHHAGYWLHGPDGKLTRAFRHICWDGCMFPNSVMMKPETWNSILATMIAVRDAHGWREDEGEADQAETEARVPTLASHGRRVSGKKPKPSLSKPASKKRASKPASKKRVHKPARKEPRKPTKRLSAKTKMKKKTSKTKSATKSSSKAKGAKKAASRRK